MMYLESLKHIVAPIEKEYVLYTYLCSYSNSLPTYIEDRQSKTHKFEGHDFCLRCATVCTHIN